MIERVDDNTPKVIQEVFRLPYEWVASLDGLGTILEVGGGEFRLGKRMLNATDIDVDASLENDYTGSATSLPFEDNSFDTVICFETIEHINENILVLEELVRVARKNIIVGSVNRTGTNFVDGYAIYKGKSNPHHLSELDEKEFESLCKGLSCQFFHSRQTIFPKKGFSIISGLSPDSLSNYVRISL